MVYNYFKPFSQNLFPTRIENAITAHPAIRQAVAVAVPDKKYGEVVGAWLVREPGTSISKEEIRTLVAQRINPQVIRKPILHSSGTDLSRLQNAPEWVWFMGEDGHANELPKTASGKIQKFILRKWSKELADKGIGEVRRSQGC